MSTESPRDLDPTRCKVGRLIVDYDLDQMKDELVDRWRGDGVDESSLRDLADYFNEQLLLAKLQEVGASPIESEASHLYQLLDDGDTSSGARREVIARLERDGIDIDELTSEFVSHQAIHTYLTEYRQVEKETERSSVDATENLRDKLDRLRSRTAAVAESGFERLRSRGDITLGSFDVFVEIRVLCDDCQRQYTSSELLRRGGCDCESTTNLADEEN